jgi:hypothetical protein
VSDPIGYATLWDRDGERLCRPGHEDDHDAGIGHRLGTNLCHGFMDLNIPLVIERKRNVHIYSTFVARTYYGSGGKVRIELFHRLKIPPNRQLSGER